MTPSRLMNSVTISFAILTFLSSLGPAAGSGPLLQPPLAQPLRLLDLLSVRPPLVRAWDLERSRQPLEARFGEEGGEPVATHLAVADVRVAVEVGVERRPG